MRQLSRRTWLKNVTTALAIVPVVQHDWAHAEERRDLTDAITKGRAFLASLFDAELGLLPEYRGAILYWLFHDNYLAAKVLKSSHPEIAKRIDTAIRSYGITRSGKIEILFDEAEKPLPFRRYKLVEVKQIGKKILKTEVVENELLEGWQEYADLQLLSAIALAKSQPAAARQNFDAATKMWDGHGFNDRVVQTAKQYATYKLALYLIAEARLKATSSIHTAVLKKLLSQQGDEGGWITDYDANGQRLGLANVETTSLAILALTHLPGVH